MANTLAVELTAGIVVGVIAYAALLFVLWLMSDRPEGAESIVLRIIKARARWPRIPMI